MINRIVNHIYSKGLLHGTPLINKSELTAFVKFLLAEGYSPEDIMEYGYAKNHIFFFDRDYCCTVFSYVDMCDIKPNLLESELYYERITVSPGNKRIDAYFTGPFEANNDLYYISEVVR